MRRYLNNWVSIVGIAVTVNFVLLGLVKPSDGATETETVLYSFRNPGNTGIQPYHPLTPVLVGADGTLYGTTANGGGGACGSPGCGTAYTLTPPALAGGVWTENTISTFSNSAFPSALAKGANGSLFGTTLYGGSHGNGMVFELIPPASSGGPWTTTSLYSFYYMPAPFSTLIVGSNGTLYGTTRGSVFELVPPSAVGGGWKEFDLHRFAGSPTDGTSPEGGLLAKNGVYYGTTFEGGANISCNSNGGCGTVYQLTPPVALGNPWTETILYSFTGGDDGFSPLGALTADANGVLYGVANGGSTGAGVVFALTPPSVPGGQWTESVAYTFAGEPEYPAPKPNPGLVFRNGALYGTTNVGGTGRQNINCPADGCGAIFVLTPPTTPGDPWTETTLHSFTGLNGDGAVPMAGLAAGSNGVMYGTTYRGGIGGIGTVFQITP